MKNFIIIVFLMFLGKNITFGQIFSQITESDRKSGMLDKMCPKGWKGWDSPADYQAACIVADKNPSQELSWIQGGINYRDYLEILVYANNSMGTWKVCGRTEPFTVSNINWILTEGKLEQGSISVLNDQAMNFVYDHKSKSFKWEKSSKGDYPNLIYFTFKNGTVLGLCKRDCNNIFVVAVKPEVFTKTETRYIDSIVYYDVPVVKQYIAQQNQEYGYQSYYTMPYYQAQNMGFSLGFGISWGYGGQQYYTCPKTASSTVIYNNYYSTKTTNNYVDNSQHIVVDNHSIVIYHPEPKADPPVIIAGGPVTPPDGGGGPITPPSGGNPITPPSGGNPITPGGGGTPYTPNGNNGNTTGGNSNTPGGSGGPQTPNAPPVFRPNRNQNEVTASNSVPYTPNTSRVERRQNEVSTSTPAPQMRAGRIERQISNNQNNENYYERSRNNSYQSANQPSQERRVERNNYQPANSNMPQQRMNAQQNFQQQPQSMERQRQPVQQYQQAPQQMMRSNFQQPPQQQSMRGNVGRPRR